MKIEPTIEFIEALIMEDGNENSKFSKIMENFIADDDDDGDGDDAGEKKSKKCDCDCKCDCKRKCDSNDDD